MFEFETGFKFRTSVFEFVSALVSTIAILSVLGFRPPFTLTDSGAGCLRFGFEVTIL